MELKSHRVDDPLPRRVSEVVRSVQAEYRVMFSSFNPFALWLMQSYLPKVPRALLVSEADDPENHWYLRTMIFAPLLKLHMLNLDQAMLSPSVLSFWYDHQVPLSVWTVNDRLRMEHFKKSGVKSIISDLAANEP